MGAQPGRGPDPARRVGAARPALPGARRGHRGPRRPLTRPVCRTGRAVPSDRAGGGVMGRLDGKVAIVTGGARGQGGAEATMFRAEGAEVVITDVLRDVGEAHAKDVGAIFLAHDVRSEEEWAEAVRETLERHGRSDVLVNNAEI